MDLELIQSIRQGDADAIEKFLSLNEVLLTLIASHYQNQGLSMEALMEVGRKTLIELIKKSDVDTIISFGAWITCKLNTLPYSDFDTLISFCARIMRREMLEAIEEKRLCQQNADEVAKSLPVLKPTTTK